MDQYKNSYVFKADPRYPVRARTVGAETLRLDKETEKKLIEDAARGGHAVKQIRNEDAYLQATLYAAETDEQAERQEQAAKKLLEAIFGEK